MADPVRGLVAESLARLAWEVPPAAERLAERLAALPVRFEVGAEVFGLEVVQARVRVAAPPPTPAVWVKTDRATVAALLDGGLDLLEAVRSDKLYLLGTLQDLRRLLRALDGYLHGAVRGFGFEDLLRRLQGAGA